jgi:hypothetical protein
MALCSHIELQPVTIFHFTPQEKKHVLPSPHCEKCKNLTENNVLFYIHVKQSFLLQRIYWNVVKKMDRCVWDWGHRVLKDEFTIESQPEFLNFKGPHRHRLHGINSAREITLPTRFHTCFLLNSRNRFFLPITRPKIPALGRNNVCMSKIGTKRKF